MPVFFSRSWWWTTLLVIAAVGVMARLGQWQLERLAERRAFNARVAAQLEQPPLALAGPALDAGLAEMEYRSVVVTGQYDFAQQVALRNQVRQGALGAHLLTPLIISGTERAVLVNRGWIPATDARPQAWRRYDEPGPVTVRGRLRRSQSAPDFGGVPDPAGRLDLWNLVNVERLRAQVSYPLLPVYLQQAPDPAWTGLPERAEPALDLSEGSHLGYAVQWFLFAGLLGLGYPFYVWETERKAAPGLGRRQGASR